VNWSEARNERPLQLYPNHRPLFSIHHEETYTLSLNGNI